MNISNKKSSVEPIRDWDKIQEIKSLFLRDGKYRNWLLFSLGLNFALRISDLLKLKIGDLYEEDMYPRNRLFIREAKTGRENVLAITNGSRDILLKYVQLTRLQYNPDEYIFKSRKGDNRPIDRIQSYRIINKVCNEVGLKDVNIGCHSMRKSWGYFAFTRFGLSLDQIMLKLNHQSLAATKHYIGLSADEKAEIEEKVCF